MKMNRTLRPVMALIAGAGLWCGCVLADSERQAAAWMEQKAHFDYLGFTTSYSCDGLKGKLRQVLRELGAKDGFVVIPLGCDRDKPVPLPAADITLSTLRRSDAPDAINTVWKKVDLGGDGPLSGGDCELAEEIVQKILPLFEVRNVHMGTTCIPHQMPTGRLSLTLEVFVPAAAP
jgi:hypothetical protein